MPDLIAKQKIQDVALAALLLSLFYLLQLVVFFGIGGRDDSYITYWSAYALSHLGEIVNYNGDRIEQSSSLLHVLLLAGLHKASGLSIPTLGIIFSSVCGIATALLTGKLARNSGVTSCKWIPFVIIFVPYFTYWSSSGMETSLAALCIVIFLSTLNTFLTQPASKTNSLAVLSAIALYILARPESAIVLLLFLSTLLAAKLFNTTHPDFKNNVKKIILLMLATLFFFATLAAWRHYYFGQIFPQPVYVKTDITHGADRFIQGLRYLEYSLNFSTTLLLFLAFGGLITLLIKNKKNIACTVKHSLLFLFAYLAFVICVGGDWMEGRRLLVPAIPLLCLLAFIGMNNKKGTYALLVLFFCLALMDSWRFSTEESIGLPPAQNNKLSYLTDQIKADDANTAEYGFSSFEQLNYSHLRDTLTIPVLDELVTSLSRNKSEALYIASRQMGMVPYYIAIRHYQKVRFIDFRGLVTKDIPDCHFIADSKPRSSSGILITSRYYLEYQPQISSSCALPIIDILYDTGLIANSAAETKKVLADYGYYAYYLQSGKDGFSLSQYIGVNNKYKNLIP